MAPILRGFSETESIESVVCVTAQHRTLLDQALSFFDITPDYDLNIMNENALAFKKFPRNSYSKTVIHELSVETKGQYNRKIALS